MKKVITILLCAALAMTLLPATALAYSDPTDASYPYNDHDYNALKAFFEAGSPKNGTLINDLYNDTMRDSPSTWETFLGVTWVQDDGEYHVETIGQFRNWNFAFDFSGLPTPNTLDLSNFTDLIYLKIRDCDSASFQAVNLSGNSKLESLYLRYNDNLETITATGCTGLQTASLTDNSLTAISLPASDNMSWLWVENNQLTSLDASGFPKLVELTCEGNPMIEVKADFYGQSVRLTRAGQGYVSLYADWRTETLQATCTPIGSYIFHDWTNYGDWDDKVSPNATFDMVLGGQNYDIVANCTDDSYTIVFDSNGGSAVSDQTVSQWGTITQPADPARSGYVFDGWYLGKDLDEAWDFDTEVNHNLVLYAKWNTAAGGGKTAVVPGNLTLYVGGKATLTPAVPGGTWQWDPAFIELHQSQVTVKALKAGHTVIHYTIGYASADIPVTILESTLPQTGQDFTWAYVLAVGAALAFSAALTFRRRVQR